MRLTRDGVVIDHQMKDDIARIDQCARCEVHHSSRSTKRLTLLHKNSCGKPDVAKLTIDLSKADGSPTLSSLEQAVADAPGIQDKKIIEHLVYTYGSEHRLLGKYSLKRIHSDLSVIEAEVIHAVREEMALTLCDLISGVPNWVRPVYLGRSRCNNVPT